MLKLHRLVPSALLLLLGGAVWADEPLKLPIASENHRLATAVASELKQGGILSNYNVDVTCVDGQIELTRHEKVQADDVMRRLARLAPVDPPAVAQLVPLPRLADREAEE